MWLSVSMFGILILADFVFYLPKVVYKFKQYKEQFIEKSIKIRSKITALS